MAKKMIKTLLKTKENEILSTCQALVQKSSIQYIENDCKMILHFTEDALKMLRKNGEYEISFEFRKNASKGKITLANGSIVLLEVILKRLEMENNRIFISYRLNDEEYEYLVEY